MAPAATLSFIGLTTTAIKLVTAAYPNASFRGASGAVPGGSSTDPHAVTDWTFIFGDGQVFASITIATAGEWGNFASPVYHGGAAGGNVIPWPVQVDIVEAAQALQAGGYTQPFSAVTLHWPIFEPAYTQPYYIFSLTGGTTMGVGAYDKTLKPF